jgi:uncharacterized protein
MSETTISVQGHYSTWYPAERATVSVSIQFDGPTRGPAFENATAAADAVKASIESRYNATSGPITWWSADSVRVWSQRPWNDQGTQLDPVHYAALDCAAKFSDFTALAEWIEIVVALDGVNVSSIEWSLTDAKTTAVTAEVRSRAVKDAVAKATVYAQSIGLGSVTATAIADPGMLGDAQSSPGGYERMAMKSSFDMGSGAPLALKPEQIEVSASVDARFTAN